jgi:hypothetical protein
MLTWTKLLDKPLCYKQEFPMNSKQNLLKKFKAFQKKKNLSCFPVISSQMFGYYIFSRDLCVKNNIMHMTVESMYEAVCTIVASSGGARRKVRELRNLYEGLGDDSFMLDNVLYERIGMSCEDVIEVILSEIVNKSH